MQRELAPPDVIAFEGRCYRLDRIAAVKDSDVRTVRVKKPYEPPTLRSLGKVNTLTGTPFSGEARRKPHG